MNEFPVVLVINCGSSSIKFSVLNASDCEVLMSGIADGINSENAFLSVNGGEPAPLAHHSYEGALKAIAFELEKRNLNDNVALIGHRIAHGGSIFTESAIITDEVIDNIRRVSPLAPLHNYANLSGIESAQQLFPGVTQVAVFDTSFHQTMAPEAYLYGLPWKYYEELGVRRYGFHGTSHRYVSQRAHSLLNLAEDDSGLVVAHLGNGASICAVRNGQSVDTSMGMTPLEGLMMGTRSGDIDAGAVTFIMEKEGLNTTGVSNLLNKKSGVLGISGVSSDMRELLAACAAGNEKAILAEKMYYYRIKKYIGAYAAALGGVDIILFTGGVGENQMECRREVCKDMEFMGIELDNDVNAKVRGEEAVISTPASKVKVVVIPTDEELLIASDTMDILNK